MYILHDILTYCKVISLHVRFGSQTTIEDLVTLLGTGL